MGNTNKAWEEWGKSDPYFGVLSSDEYRKGRLSDEARGKFFQSGEDHVERILTTIRSHLDPAFQPGKSLDFGCGVGRLLLPLARISSVAVGIDISESMLAEARRNCELYNVSNIRLVQSDSELSRLDGGFNLIHSSIVFQHIPARRGEKLCAHLLERLQPGGVVALNFDYRSFSSRAVRGLVRLRYAWPLANRMRNLLKGLPANEPAMERNVYDLGNLVALCSSYGIDRLFLETSQHDGFAGVILYGQKRF